jgi:hypothetical protein
MGDRISLLENYKILCERRLKDLDPNHQLPVSPEHLGMRPIQLQHADALN